MASLDLSQPADYAIFLRLQLAARAPIEAWAARYCGDVALRPPESAPLLRADLARLGDVVEVPDSGFAFPEGGDMLGLAWAVAGSHLGNRMLLKRVPDHLPTSFLADPRLPVFWKQLRPRLDVAAENAPAAGALAAANAVFACFADAFGSSTGRLAA